jgi:hypothetical protein
MDSLVLIQHFATEEIIHIIVELVKRNQEIGEELKKMATPQDDVIDANWVKIDAQLNALESIVGSDSFNKHNFQYLLASVISHISDCCVNNYSVEKNTKSFVVRICEMFARNAHPSEYDFDKFVF